MKYRRIRFGQLGKNQTVDFAVQEPCRCVKLMDSEIMTEVLCADTIQPAFPNVIWVGLAESLEAMEQQDEEALKKYGAQVRDIINLNEPFLQKHMDGRNTHRIFSLRTGLEKTLPFVNRTAPKEDCTV